jgi:putative transcriptional regulator
LIEIRVFVFVKGGMGLIRLRVREFAEQRGWTLKEVSNRTGIPYTTIATYAKSTGMATVDYTAIYKMARVFDVSVEDLVEIVEE